MRIKWLLNVESILLEHIAKCQQENPQSAVSYPVNSSFISMIILNFLKIFMIRNTNHDQDDLSFYQFGLTSYLRYFLLELPTFEHGNSLDENECFYCKQYSLIMNILFDLLFDFMEFDLCEISNEGKSRSSLIEEDYFHQLKSMKKTPFFRIQFLIYLIELIALHRQKCSK